MSNIAVYRCPRPAYSAELPELAPEPCTFTLELAPEPVAAPGGGMGGANAPLLEALPPHLPPQSEWDFFFFFYFFFFFFFTYVVSHTVTNLKLISAFSAISVSINKVIHRRSIVYNIQWCGIIYGMYIHESHSYRCSMVYL